MSHPHREVIEKAGGLVSYFGGPNPETALLLHGICLVALGDYREELAPLTMIECLEFFVENPEVTAPWSDPLDPYEREELRQYLHLNLH